MRTLNDFVLASSGLIPKRLFNIDKHGEPDNQQVELCEKWISRNCKKAKEINPEAYSYWLKHKVEEWSVVYVSNGAFIAAALNLGYRMRISGDNGPNSIFDMVLLLPEKDWSRIRPLGFSRWLFKQAKLNNHIGDFARDAIEDEGWPRKAKRFIDYRFYLAKKERVAEYYLNILVEAWRSCYKQDPPFPNDDIHDKCQQMYDKTCDILNFDDSYQRAPENKTYIYALFEDETDSTPMHVRYIGQTQSPSIRLKQHILSPGSINKVIWTGKLLAAGVYPRMGILDMVSITIASKIEEMFILAFFEYERKHGQVDNVLFNISLLEKYKPIFNKYPR